MRRGDQFFRIGAGLAVGVFEAELEAVGLVVEDMALRRQRAFAVHAVTGPVGFCRAYHASISVFGVCDRICLPPGA